MITIDDNYRIEKLTYGYRLVYKKEVDKIIKGKVKKVTSTKEWHYSNVKQCLKRYVNETIDNSDSMGDIIKKLNQLESFIDKIDFGIAKF